MKDYVRGKMSGFHLSISDKELLSPDDLDPKAEVLGVFVGSKVDKAVFATLPHLKLIVTMSTGFDHIDLTAAKKRKIPICNVPTYGENTVAEHAMSLLLALSRKLFPSVKRVKEGSFNYEGLRGFDLKGKTVGVIGTGNIGKHVLRMLKGFDMTVLAYDAFPNKDLQKQLGFAYVPLQKLLASSDVITLHVPLFKETTHMINKKNIKKLKKGAYIINTARGGIIESEALLWGLETGHIAGAGLDVLEEEEMLQHPEHVVLKHYSDEEIKLGLISNMLIDHPNVIITPHNAFNSMEALARIMDTTIENVKAFASGQTQNDVTAPKRTK